MRYTAKYSSTKIIAVGYLILLVFLVLMMAAIMMLIYDNRTLRHEQKTLVIPMGFKAPFAIADNFASVSYLEMYAIALIALRLNVSPGTIEMQHQLLLSFVRPGAQPDMKLKLAREAEVIVKTDVDTLFSATSIRVYPNAGLIDIRGDLTTWIGSRKNSIEPKRFALRYEHVDGHTWLTSFTEVENEK
ncbi:type IV conjugative transfer system protein TraE [Pantoea sp. DY-15]|uniref:type IV conjugative transfer system protein TraE n=1 Tax=Pantoea sp. DY-15 TaxID=2871489 RepID=UPI001C97AC85|nr:type IV conjugative transfer system protein TraE [Pantoea sp. DY-15]MBY4890601.1 type IV conjugative transfer system protein TraE [Pantoea sp. DY-15]